MGVPEQVRKQTEKVQQLYADLNTDPDGEPTNGKTPAQGGDTANSAAPTGATEPTSTPSSNEPGEGGQSEETFEQKYRTLQGKYNAEVPTLNAQVKELTERLDQTQQLLATMQAVPATQQTDPQPSPSPQSLLTDAEKEEYGDSIDIMRKVTQEVVTPYQQEILRLQQTIQQLQGQVVPRVEQLSQQQSHTAEQYFWSTLDAAVPDWREINNNADFQTWLLDVDPLTGMTRQAYLDDAQQKLDANRVASFFSAWQGTSGGTAQTTPSTQQASELERQIAPGRGRSTPAPQGDEKTTYTQKDIAKFFDDVRAGRYKGKEDERGRIERDIFAAQAEGRIVQA